MGEIEQKVSEVYEMTKIERHTKNDLYSARLIRLYSLSNKNGHK